MRTSHSRIEQIVREKAGSMTDQEFFTSPSYAGYLTDIAEAVSGRYQRTPTVELVWEEDNRTFVAQTDDLTIRINAGHFSIRNQPTRPLRALSILGNLGHELGHLLYTDFPAMRQYQDDILDGKLLPEIDDLPEDWEKNRQDVLDTLLHGDEAEKQTILYAAHGLFNILEDAYIEARMFQDYPGKLASGIRLNNRCHKDWIPTIQEQIDGDYMAYAIISNLLIQHCKNDEVNNPEGYSGEYLEVLEDCKPILDGAKFSDVLEVRYKAVNRLLFRLWPYIQELVDHTRQEMAEQKALQAVLDALKERLKKEITFLLQETEGDSEAVEITAVLSGGDGDAGDSHGEDEAEQDFNQVFRQAVKDAAAERMEGELLKALRKVAKESNGASYAGYTTKVHRDSEVTPAMVLKGKELLMKLRPISRALQRSVANALKAKREGGKLTGLLMGKRLDARTLYRRDARHFYNLRLPEEISLAVTVLVDESGSMNRDDRILSAKEAAMLLYDFCHALDIPVAIYGHDCSFGTVNLYSYAEFDSADGKDVYRITGMMARDGNHDGAALRFAMKRLLTRPEEIRLLFLISDGRPAAYGYGGEEAMKDLREIKKECGRQGITLFAAAIGDDKPQLQEIYGDSFLDMTDLSRLPANLGKQLSKFIH